VNDPETFNALTGKILTALSQKETYQAAWNGIVQEITTSRGIGHIAGDTLSSMVGIGLLKKGKAVIKSIDFLNENELRKYWKREVEFDGIKVYQRDDLFDVNQMTTWRENGKTIQGTNLERMTLGMAPEGVDGKSVNLHHTIQADAGPIAEILETMHKEYDKLIHVNVPKKDFPSGINRPKFNKWREDYWRARALSIKEGANE
jgi:filamentous hemagglutinin